LSGADKEGLTGPGSSGRCRLTAEAAVDTHCTGLEGYPETAAQTRATAELGLEETVEMVTKSPERSTIFYLFSLPYDNATMRQCDNATMRQCDNADDELRTISFHVSIGGMDLWPYSWLPVSTVRVRKAGLPM